MTELYPLSASWLYSYFVKDRLKNISAKLFSIPTIGFCYEDIQNLV